MPTARTVYSISADGVQSHAAHTTHARRYRESLAPTTRDSLALRKRELESSIAWHRLLLGYDKPKSAHQQSRVDSWWIAHTRIQSRGWKDAQVSQQESRLATRLAALSTEYTDVTARLARMESGR
jgi:hypothetical protein